MLIHPQMLQCMGSGSVLKGFTTASVTGKISKKNLRSTFVNLDKQLNTPI